MVVSGRVCQIFLFSVVLLLAFPRLGRAQTSEDHRRVRGVVSAGIADIGGPWWASDQRQRGTLLPSATVAVHLRAGQHWSAGMTMRMRPRVTHSGAGLFHLMASARLHPLRDDRGMVQPALLVEAGIVGAGEAPVVAIGGGCSVDIVLPRGEAIAQSPDWSVGVRFALTGLMGAGIGPTPAPQWNGRSWPQGGVIFASGLVVYF